ncbi:MAG: DHH family phosphoesterase, partial [Bacteroidales bacterium]|nr:DHH family phosphoesterase [Bacteroidales bacterium]
MLIDTSNLEPLLSAARDIVLVGHFNPDGDAVGSVTAAYHYLKARGKRPRIILPSPYPETMAFLEPEDSADRIVICENAPDEARRLVGEADMVVCLDLNRLSRTEYLEGDILGSKAVKVLIDHHIAAELDRFDVAVSTIEVSSTCELLYWTFLSLPDIAGDPGRLPLRCAESIYVGMMTDTNNFSNSVFPGTFEMASRLIARGVDKTALQEKVLSSYSVSRTRLMGHMVKDKMKVLDRHQAAYMLLSNKEKDRYHFQPGDSEGFVNLPLAIRSVMVSALFTENFDGRYIRVSLRSKGSINVNRFASRFFNGGGHRNAAGGRLYIPLEKVPAYFEQALENWT